MEISGLGLDVIDAAPEGLYQILGQAKIGDYYRPQTDEFVTGVALILMCRIDQGKEFPAGVAKSYFRNRDGARVVMMWAEPISKPWDAA